MIFSNSEQVETCNMFHLTTIFLFATTLVFGKKHETKIEISGVYKMDKVEGDMQGFYAEHLKSLHQLMISSKGVTSTGIVGFLTHKYVLVGSSNHIFTDYNDTPFFLFFFLFASFLLHLFFIRFWFLLHLFLSC